MATAISGWGPGAHDSSVSLGTLIPNIARIRDRSGLWTRGPMVREQGPDEPARGGPIPAGRAVLRLTSLRNRDEAPRLQCTTPRSHRGRV